MNYLIVMPKGSTMGETTHDIIFPLGIAYVSASLKQAGYSVTTANLEYCDGDTDTILQDLIVSNNIDVICTGGLSRDCHKIKGVFDSARAINARIITVAGGGIITADPEPAMNVVGADIGVIGEGEITICELAKALDNGSALDDVDGLIYKDKDGVLIRTKPRQEIMDIDSIPLPDFDGFSYSKYARVRGGLIVGSRSCPCKCTYCFHPSGKTYRQRSLDSVFGEMDYQIKNFNINAFGLTEELFANSKKRVLDFCGRVKARGVSWVCAMRVCDVDLGLLTTMKASGCEAICFGLESADNIVLKSMRKNITVEQIEYALNSCYEAGIRVVGQFIFGDIAENMDTVKTTLEFWYKHNMQTEISLNMIIAYPGSYLYKHACSTGLIKDKEQFLNNGCPLVNLSLLSDTEYADLLSLTEELKLHPHTMAKEIRINEIQQDGNCKLEAVCRKCGARTSHEMFFWFKNAYPCPTCSLNNEVDPFTVASHCQDRFYKNIPADEMIVMWGAGGIYYKLINEYSILRSDNFILVDGNPARKGLRICNKVIESPDVMAERKVTTVLIAALSRKDEIIAHIKGHCPTVTSILIPSIELDGTCIIPVVQQLNLCGEI